MQLCTVPAHIRISLLTQRICSRIKSAIEYSITRIIFRGKARVRTWVRVNSFSMRCEFATDANSRTAVELLQQQQQQQQQL